MNKSTPGTPEDLPLFYKVRTLYYRHLRPSRLPKKPFARPCVNKSAEKKMISPLRLIHRSWFLLDTPDSEPQSSSSSSSSSGRKTINFRPREWDHFCFSFDSPSSSARVVVDGMDTAIDGRSYPGLRDVRLPADLLDK